MDTHSTELPLPESEALRRIVDQVLAGGDAVMSASGVEALLDEAAEVLARRRCGVLRASGAAPGGLSLSGLMAQVTERPDLDAHDDEVLERGFQALTIPDADCDAVVLVIDGAEALQRTALRYLQFTCRSAPALRLVLAGDGEIPVLQEDEMASLRTRLAANPVIAVALGPPEAPPVAPAAPVPGRGFNPVPLPPSRPQVVLASPAPPGMLLPGALPLDAGLGAFDRLAPRPAGAALPRPQPSGHLPPAPAKVRRRAPVAWAGIGLGMAASVALGVLIGRHDWPSLSGEAVQPAPQAPLPRVAPQVAPGAALNDPARANAAPPHAPAEQRSNVPAAPAVAASQAVIPQAETAARQPPISPAIPSPDSSLPESAPPAAPARISPAIAAPPDPAPPRPRSGTAPARQPETRPRERASPASNRAPLRPLSRSTQNFEARDHDPGLNDRDLSYAPPGLPDAAPGRAGERRPVIGTFTTDQNGVRTFRAIP